MSMCKSILGEKKKKRFFFWGGGRRRIRETVGSSQESVGIPPNSLLSANEEGVGGEERGERGRETNNQPKVWESPKGTILSYSKKRGEMF